MTSLELLQQQLVDFREESDAAVETHKTHIEREASATIKEGHDLLRKLKLAERDERRARKQEPLQNTPLTSRLPTFDGTMDRAALENYRDVARKRKANNGYDATAIALGSTAAFHSAMGTPHAQYRMAQQQQQMMMYQQAMQQQSMANAQWTGARSAPFYAVPSQNAWAHLSSANQSNLNAQFAAQSQQQNQIYGMRSNGPAAVYGYPSIPQTGGATPVTTNSSMKYGRDSVTTKSYSAMDSSMLQYNTNNVLQQHHNAKGNAPASADDDVLSNEDAAAILALVEKESVHSASAAMTRPTATPSTTVANQNFPYGMSHNMGLPQATQPPGVPANYGTMTMAPQTTGSGQQNTSTPTARWSYY